MNQQPPGYPPPPGPSTPGPWGAPQYPSPPQPQPPVEGSAKRSPALWVAVLLVLALAGGGAFLILRDDDSTSASSSSSSGSPSGQTSGGGGPGASGDAPADPDSPDGVAEVFVDGLQRGDCDVVVDILSEEALSQGEVDLSELSSDVCAGYLPSVSDDIERTGPATIDGDRATVEMASPGALTAVHLTLVREGDGWKVDDMAFGSNSAREQRDPAITLHDFWVYAGRSDCEGMSERLTANAVQDLGALGFPDCAAYAAVFADAVPPAISLQQDSGPQCEAASITLSTPLEGDFDFTFADEGDCLIDGVRRA